jgi:NADPH-dependent curcumin reductase CurA
LGADFTINYKKNPVKDALKGLFKGGIDVYFDNVGG